MDVFIWLVIGILVILGIVVVSVLFITRAKQKQRKTDYRGIFILGMCFLPMGIVYMVIGDLFPMGAAFLGLALCYMAIGLANKDKWEKESEKLNN